MSFRLLDEVERSMHVAEKSGLIAVIPLLNSQADMCIRPAS
jgi:hypothetical protein